MEGATQPSPSAIERDSSFEPRGLQFAAITILQSIRAARYIGKVELASRGTQRITPRSLQRKDFGVNGRWSNQRRRTSASTVPHGRRSKGSTTMDRETIANPLPSSAAPSRWSEDVEISGHIIDSLILPKVLDCIS